MNVFLATETVRLRKQLLVITTRHLFFLSMNHDLKLCSPVHKFYPFRKPANFFIFFPVGLSGLSSSQRNIFESDGLCSAFQVRRHRVVRHVEEYFGGKLISGYSNSLQGCDEGKPGTKGRK